MVTYYITLNRSIHWAYKNVGYVVSHEFTYAILDSISIDRPN
jgi:hypothetical protein